VKALTRVMPSARTSTESATLFALADVRRVLVHCDGTDKGVDFVIALLAISDRMLVDEARG